MKQRSSSLASSSLGAKRNTPKIVPKRGEISVKAKKKASPKPRRGSTNSSSSHNSDYEKKNTVDEHSEYGSKHGHGSAKMIRNAKTKTGKRKSVSKPSPGGARRASASTQATAAVNDGGKEERAIDGGRSETKKGGRSQSEEREGVTMDLSLKNMQHLIASVKNAHVHEREAMDWKMKYLHEQQENAQSCQGKWCSNVSALDDVYVRVYVLCVCNY